MSGIFGRPEFKKTSIKLMRLVFDSMRVHDTKFGQFIKMTSFKNECQFL